MLLQPTTILTSENVCHIVNEVGLTKGGLKNTESSEQFFTTNWPVFGGIKKSTKPEISNVWLTVSQAEKEKLTLVILQKQEGSVNAVLWIEHWVESVK